MDRCVVKMCRRIWVGPLELVNPCKHLRHRVGRLKLAERARMNMPEINARPDPFDRRGHIKNHIDRPHLPDLASGFDHKADVSLAQLRHESLKVFGKPARHIGFGRAVERPGMQHDFARAQNVGLLIGP